MYNLHNIIRLAQQAIKDTQKDIKFLDNEIIGLSQSLRKGEITNKQFTVSFNDIELQKSYHQEDIQKGEEFLLGIKNTIIEALQESPKKRVVKFLVSYNKLQKGEISILNVKPKDELETTLISLEKSGINISGEEIWEDHEFIKSDENDIVKGLALGNLVPKKVQVRRKDGATYFATRYINPDTGESHKLAKPSPKAEVHTKKGDIVDQIESISTDMDMKTGEKVNSLLNIGLYDKHQLSRLINGTPANVYYYMKKAGFSSAQISNFSDREPTIPAEVNPETGEVETDPISASSALEQKIQALIDKAGIEFADPTEVVGDPNAKIPKDAIDSTIETYTDLVARKLRKMAIFYGPGGIGKAQPLSAQVLTPYGFKTMGDIKTGDKVITGSGNESIVLAEFPQGERGIYQVDFADGRSVRCDIEHLWNVKDRNTGAWKTLRLQDILDRGLTLPNESWRYGVPIFSGWTYKGRKSSLKIDAWLLGFLLGDGCFYEPGTLLFSVGERDRDFILGRIQTLVEGDCEIRYRGHSDYALCAATPTEDDKKFRSQLSRSIADYQLYGTRSETKFIPEEYLKARREDRIALIQGLMDSDGYINKNGACQFYSCSRKLAEQVKEIVCSLGARYCSLTESTYNKDKGIGKISYTVSFRFSNDIIPVSLPFKLERIRLNDDRIDSLSIVRVSQVEREEAKCILIDDPSHLYVTDDYIVTHNTYGVKQVLTNPSTKSVDGKEFGHEMVEYDPEIGTTKDEYDFIKFGGKMSGTKLFKALYEHNGKLIFLDDIDAVLMNEDMVNILKIATDSTPEQVVWDGAPIKADDGETRLPTRFTFRGSIILNTNLPEHVLREKAGPILDSRALALDCTRSMKDTIDKLDRIKDVMPFYNTKGDEIEISQDAREAAVNFVKKYKDFMPVERVNGRTIGHLATIYDEFSGRFSGPSDPKWFKEVAAVSVMSVTKRQIFEFQKNKFAEEQKRKKEVRALIDAIGNG